MQITGVLIILHVIYVSTGYNYDDKEGAYLRSLDLGWARHAGRDLQQNQCVPIPKDMTLCRNVGYVNMSIPNLLGHDTVEEVRRQAAPWNMLYKIRCHSNTDLFLCSLYAPVCLDRHIFPCKSLCEAVKSSCEMRMNKYGYTWPEILNCDKFPEDDDLCIKQINVSNDEGKAKWTGLDVASGYIYAKEEWDIVKNHREGSGETACMRRLAWAFAGLLRWSPMW